MRAAIKWHDSNKVLPREGHDVLVAFDINEIAIRYYVSPEPDHAYGWYPGGMDTKDTFWAVLPKTPFD